MGERRLETREAIEVYISEGNFICLKQENAYKQDEDVIMMNRHDVPIVIKWLQELLVELEAND